jgi:hypothetical protein
VLHHPKVQQAPRPAPGVGLSLDEHARSNEPQGRTAYHTFFDRAPRRLGRTARDAHASAMLIDGKHVTGKPHVVAGFVCTTWTRNEGRDSPESGEKRW